MADYSNHTRIVYANYADIATAIEEGKINANDIVLCKDTQQIVYVKSDLTYFPIQSKSYVFDSDTDAIKALNVATDTYEGQIVSIKNEAGSYDAYTVYKDGDGYDLKAVLSSSVSFDYNQATHKPIRNVLGYADDPAVINELEDGIYRVGGVYQISEGYDSVTTDIGHIAIVETIDGIRVIRVITTRSITDYTVVLDGNITETYYVTKKWLNEQKYVQQEYVDNLAEDMIHKQVPEVIIDMLDYATEDELNALFN